MSKVNVRLDEFFTTPAYAQISVESVLIASQSVVVGTRGALPGRMTERADVTGLKQFVLHTGRYRVTAESGKANGQKYDVLIDVPNDALEYEHTQLIVSGAAPFSQPIPVQSNATADDFGIIRLNASGFGIPEFALTKLGARAIASSRLKTAGWVIVLGGVARGDGGGGLFSFKLAGVEADDDASYLRPDDYAMAGANQGTLEKLV